MWQIIANNTHSQVNKLKTQATTPAFTPADLLIFLADVRLDQRVGNLFEMWFEEVFGAAAQHCGEHHEWGPGV